MFTAARNRGAAVDLFLSFSDGALQVARNHGDGTFGPLQPVNLPAVRTAVGRVSINGPELILAGLEGGILLAGLNDSAATPSTQLLFPENASSVATGDFDGDGLPDVAVLSTDLTVHLAAPGRDPIRLIPKENLTSIAAADLNGDGRDDLALTAASGMLLVVPSLGGGAFAEPVRYDAHAHQVCILDWDGDGVLDAVVSTSQGLSVLSGRSDGTLQPAHSLFGHPVDAIAGADITGHGEPGLLLLAADSDSDPWTISFLPANRNAPRDALSSASSVSERLALRSHSAAATGGVSMTLSGPPGPVLIGQSIALTAQLSPATTTGTVVLFEAGIPLGVAAITNGNAVLSTNFSGGGAHSLYVIHIDSGAFSNRLAVSAASLPASDMGAGSAYSAGANPQALVSADFNSDGKRDLAIVNAANSTVSILIGKGDGTMWIGKSFPVGAGASAITVGDFNLDGIPDLAVTNSADTSVSVLLGVGDGTFQAQKKFSTGWNPVSVICADLNNDGFPDLAVLNADGGSVSILGGNGNGTFRPAVTAETGSAPVAMAAGDFNGDGIVDLATANLTGTQVTILTGKGTGLFYPPVSYSAGIGPVALAVSDFNGDGAPDVAVAVSGDPMSQQGAGVAVLLNVGGVLQSPTLYPTGAVPVGLTVADMNGDGILDLAVATLSGISVIPGGPRGTFGSPISYPAVPSSTLSSGDFNGDGVVDLAVAGFTTGRVAVLPWKPVPCTYSVSPSSVSLDALGGPLTFTVAANSPVCAWSTSADSWLTLASSGMGNGVLNVAVAPNTSGVERLGSLSVGGQSAAVKQWGTAANFTDVTTSDYYFDAANLMAMKGITTGCQSSASGIAYCPTQPVTRAQMAIFLIRAIYGGDQFPYSPTPYFDDVPPSGVGFKWIQKMAELGITTGCGPTTYCPNMNISRDQMAVFIIRARFGATATFSYPSTPYFTDVPQSYWAYPYIQRMRMDGITGGCAPNQYCPGSLVSRGDMAIFVMRGAFNMLVPPSSPAVTQISPASLTRGSSGSFTITGVNTNFAQGVTTLLPIAGITVSNVSVSSPTTLTVALSADSGAAIMPRSITMQTGSEQAVLPNGLKIQ
jgi:hypothetical protein